jgi:hypothetical protein
VKALADQEVGAVADALPVTDPQQDGCRPHFSDNYILI